MLVQITEQARDEAQKTALYARRAELLEERGVAGGDDVVVSVVENTPGDWSFGYGRAQFLTGELENVRSALRRQGGGDSGPPPGALASRSWRSFRRTEHRRAATALRDRANTPA